MNGERQIVRAELDFRVFVPERFGLGAHGDANLNVVVTQRHDEGYVSFAETVERETEEETVLASRTTHCELRPGCEGQTARVPELGLLVCFPDAARSARRPMPALPAAPLVPPPYDRVEGLKRRHQQQLRFDPRPPSVREIIGY